MRTSVRGTLLAAEKDADRYDAMARRWIGRLIAERRVTLNEVLLAIQRLQDAREGRADQAEKGLTTLLKQEWAQTTCPYLTKFPQTACQSHFRRNSRLPSKNGLLMGDLVSIFLLSLLAMFNPTLLAAVTVMMLLPNTKKLMFGYLMGAYTTSIALGLLIVFSLSDSDAVSTTKRSLSPVEDIAVGLILLLVAYVLAGRRTEPLRERRRRRKEAKEAKGEAKEPWPQRMLGRGSARVTFAVGALLSFPGVSYLTGLDRIAKLDAATVPTALLVIAFCLMQQLLLEVPLLGYAIAPERTQRAVTGFRDWLARNGMRAATIVAAVLGALLVLRGLIELLA